MTAENIVQEWYNENGKKGRHEDFTDLARRIEAYAEARVAGLREALERIAFKDNMEPWSCEIARESLASTPSRLVQVGWSDKYGAVVDLDRIRGEGRDWTPVYRFAGEGNEKGDVDA